MPDATMLAAVQATDERRIAPRYLTRIFAHLAPPYCVIAGLVKHLSHTLDASQSESHLH